MSLNFDGSAHQYVGTAAGAIGPAGVGDYTIVTLYQPSGNGSAASLWSGSLTGTNVREILTDNDGSGNDWYGISDFSGFASWTANTWYLVGQSKAAGSNPYRWHTWPYAANGSGTKTHGNGSGTHSDGAAIAGIRIGDGDDRGFGSVALVAIWNRVLSDADFDALCGNTAQAFMDLPSGAPNALLLCNVTAPGSVIDATGSGANATTVVGSGITIGADPPSFNYTLTSQTNVRFDTVGPSSAGTDTSFDITWSHTCSGANRAVVVGLCYTDQTPADRPLTATFGGVAMTQLGAVESNNAGNGFIMLFGLANPPAGTSTVEVTDDTGGGHKMIGGSVSFNGVSQTTPFGVAVTGAGDNSSGSNPPSVIVNSGANDMVVDALCYGSAISGANQTLRWMDNVSDSISAAGNADQSTAPGASSVTMSYTPTLHDWWGMVAVDVRAVSNPSLFVNNGAGMLALVN